jgi:bacterioferritin-associated ferredoxin
MDNFCSSDRCGDCPGRFVCRCLQVTEDTLVEALSTRGIRTIKDIRLHTGAGDGCTACHSLLRKYLEKQTVFGHSEQICA